jgi:hypothetical protein
MKKKLRKLTVSRETVHSLQGHALEDALGAGTGPRDTWCDVCTEATNYCTVCVC